MRALSSNDLLSWQLRAELAQRDATLAQRDGTIALLQAELDQRDGTIALLQAKLDQRDGTIARLQAELDQRAAQGEWAQARIVQGNRSGGDLPVLPQPAKLSEPPPTARFSRGGDGTSRA